MTREIKVYSMSVLDLLTCALGGTILVSFLLIVSIEQSGKAGFPYSYFVISAGVWVDVTERARSELAATAPQPSDSAGDAIFSSEELERLAHLPADFEVELEIYRKRGSTGSKTGGVAGKENAARPDLSVPRNAEKPFFRVNSAGHGLERGSDRGGTNLIRRSESLGVRRVKLNGVNRLYAAYRLDVAGFEVQRGWYFVRLSIVKDKPGKIGKENAAWLRIDSGGSPAASRFQTHEVFDDPEWPDRGGYESIKHELRVEKQRHHFLAHPELARQTMQKLRWPDLYLPGWPDGYPITTSHNSARFVVNVGPTDWPRFFSLRQRRDSGRPSSSAARLPDPGNAPSRSPGWHQSETETTSMGETIWDDYLPGFRIGSENQP
jgi:hypothetical protein